MNNKLHLRRRFAWIFVRGHGLFPGGNSFPRASLEESVSCEEQIMSNYKYPNIHHGIMDNIP